MGLDSVELVMEAEEEFQIAFASREVEDIRTVGEFVDVIFSRLRRNESEQCPTQHAFYVVRKRVMETLGVKREAVRPDTRLEELVPREGRAQVWRRLIKAVSGTEDDWPPLERAKRSKRVRVMAFVVAPAVVSVASLALLRWQSLPLVWVGVSIVTDRVTRLPKTEIPEAYSRVKDLVKYARTLDMKVWTREEVFEKVRRITAEQLGVKKELVTMEARFVEDLGMS